MFGPKLLGDCASTTFQCCLGGGLLVFIDVVDITGFVSDRVEVVTVNGALFERFGPLLRHLLQLLLLDGFVAFQFLGLGNNLVVLELDTVLLNDGIPSVLR